jgi:hypothetical protein
VVFLDELTTRTLGRNEIETETFFVNLKTLEDTLHPTDHLIVNDVAL